MSMTTRVSVSGLLVGLLLLGLSGRTCAQGREGRGGADVRAVFKSADTGKGTITVTVGDGRRDAAPEDKTYTLAKDVEVAIGNAGRGVGGLFKEGKLADVPAG